jgi:ketopantoate reductase
MGILQAALLQALLDSRYGELAHLEKWIPLSEKIMRKQDAKAAKR